MLNIKFQAAVCLISLSDTMTAPSDNVHDKYFQAYICCVSSTIEQTVPANTQIPRYLN